MAIRKYLVRRKRMGRRRRRKEIGRRRRKRFREKRCSKSL